MPKNGVQVHPAVPVAAGVALVLVGAGLYLGRKKAPSTPSRGAVSALGLPSLRVLLQEAGRVSALDLPSLGVLLQEAGRVSALDLPSLGVLV